MPPPVEMTDGGFGSHFAPDFVDTDAEFAVDVYDLGFGSEDVLGTFGTVDVTQVTLDAGFGSPIVLLSAALTDGSTVLPDDGSSLLEIVAGWPIRGPYEVHIVEQDGTSWPCYGLTLGEGEDAGKAFADERLTSIRVGVPRAPVGVYDVVVSWIDSAAQSVTLENALTIVYRTRIPKVYEGRRFFARLFATGSRAVENDPVLGS